MKKTKKTLLTALAFTSAVGMTSCDLFGQALYGPPPDYSSESSESSYNPQDDDMQTEYEAPIAYETMPKETTVTTTQKTISTTEKKTVFTTVKTTEPVTDNDYIQTEYGAPVAYETTTEEITEPVTEEYDPIKDRPSLVYGPPPDFD